MRTLVATAAASSLPFFFDRFAFAFSLASHIILASVGIALPLIIFFAEIIAIKNKDKHFALLARRMTLVLIILFALGTASGMVVATELLFLWPSFMALVGQTSIMSLFVEVGAFFIEALALAIYFYFDSKFKNRYAHAALMGIVAIGAAASGVLITTLNAFMNTPVGFNIQQYLSNGIITGVQPFAVFTSPAAFMEVTHVLATSYFAGTFIFIAFFAWHLMKSRTKEERTYHRKAIELALVIGVFATFFAIYTGLYSISTLYHVQPEKYAAIEGNFAPNQSYAPENIFGIPSANGTSIVGGINITDLQSELATGYPNGTVPGLDQFPQSTWPPLFVHDMFDILVLGAALAALVLLAIMFLILIERKPIDNHKVLWLLIAMGVLAVALLENGWVMAELARQPWIVYNVMLVSQAANYSPSIIPIAIMFVAFYIFAFPFIGYLINRVFKHGKPEDELEDELERA